MEDCEHKEVFTESIGSSTQKICMTCGAVVHDQELQSDYDIKSTKINNRDDYIPPIHFKDAFKRDDFNIKNFFKKRRIITDVRQVVNQLHLDIDNSVIEKAALMYIAISDSKPMKCKTAMLFECVRLNHPDESKLPTLLNTSNRLGVPLKKFTQAKKRIKSFIQNTSITAPSDSKNTRDVSQKNMDLVVINIIRFCENFKSAPEVREKSIKLCNLLNEYNLLSFHNPLETANSIFLYVSHIHTTNSLIHIYSRKISDSGCYNMRIQKINSLLMPVFNSITKNLEVPFTWDIFLECLAYIEERPFSEIYNLIKYSSRKHTSSLNKIEEYRTLYSVKAKTLDFSQIKYDSHENIILDLIHKGYSDEDILKIDVDSICRDYHVSRLSNMSEQDFDKEVDENIKSYIEQQIPIEGIDTL